MPNWIEGTLKLRGKREDIKKFLDEGLVTVKDQVFDNSKDGYFVKDTRRAFIESNFLYTEKYEGTVCMNVKQAWEFDVEDWAHISETYNLDLKLCGIECGMQFCQVIAIHKPGKVVKDKTIQYADWVWECPFPFMGG